MTIDLPQNLSWDQYEDFVVAALRALGYFVEPRLVLRDGTKEVLELDVVASPVGAMAKDRILFEVKKGYGISFAYEKGSEVFFAIISSSLTTTKSDILKSVG